MKEIIRRYIQTAYSLHDMGISAITADGDKLTLNLSTGMIRVGSPCCQVDGCVIFEGVQWDFCYVYIFGHVGNSGIFSGEKMLLQDFLKRYPMFNFTVMDETYGCNLTKYGGYFSAGAELCECFLEIYHEGDMIYREQVEHSGMDEVILSHDGEAMLCLVPAEAAAHLERYCLDFASSWVWHGPENGRFLQRIDEDLVGAVFGTADFIDYLERWAFPGAGSRIVKGLGCEVDEIPTQYEQYPRYNF